MGDGFAGELEWGLERLGDVGEDVGAAVDEALVGDEPGAPVGAVIRRSGEIGDRLGGVGDVLVEAAATGRWGRRRRERRWR